MAVNAGDISVVQQDIIAQTTNYSQRILFVGVKNSAGSAGHLELKTVSSINDINTFFGANSHIAQGLRMALEFNENRAIEHNLYFDAIALDPATDATNSIANATFTGTASATQDITLYAGNDKSPIIFTVAKNDTASQIANKMILAVNAKITLPYIATIDAVNTAKVILTSTQKSSFLNNLSIEFKNLPTGVSVETTKFADGTNGTVSDIAKLRTAIDNKQYHCVVIEKDFFSLDSDLKEFFNNRMIRIINMHKQGHVVCSFISDYSALNSFVAPFNTYQYGVFTPIKETTHLPFLIATYQALIMTSILVLNYNVSDIITTSNGRGSPECANQPINEIYMQGMRPIENNYTNDELKNIKTMGYLTLENTDDNRYVQITGNQSTYTTTPQGQVANLNRINEITRKIIIGKKGLEVAKTLKGKQLVAISDGEAPYQRTVEDVVNTIMTDLFDVLGSSQGDGTTVYRYIKNDPQTRQEVEARVRNSVQQSYQSGTRTLTIDTIMSVLKNIENIIISQSFN